MSIASMCKQTITIQQSAVTAGAMGGESRAWTTRDLLSDIHASIQNKGGALATQFAQRGICISHAIYTETDISAAQIGDRVTDDCGRTYVVRYVSDMAAQGRSWAMLVDLISPS